MPLSWSQRIAPTQLQAAIAELESWERRHAYGQLVLCPADNFAKSFEFGKDGVGRCGPHEGPGVLIVVFDELMDFAFQVGHRVERAAADGALRDEPEPALNLIEPGGVGGRVVNVEAWTACEPRFDLSVFVRAVVVDDEVDVQVLRNI